MFMSTNSWKRALAAVGSASAMGLLFTSFGVTDASAATGAQKPHLGGNILLDTTSNFQHIDPALSYFSTDAELTQEMYEPLITYAGPQGKIVPALAKSWQVTDGGKTYTFHIRPGMKFWNGDPVTAQSFIDEFERVLGRDGIVSPGEGFIDPIIVGSTAYHKHPGATPPAGISAPNSLTFVIKLTKPEEFFPMVLAMPFFAPVDQKWIDQVGVKAFDVTKPMGTGPFMLQSSNANGAVLVKNPQYWRTDQWGNHLPYLDKVTIRINKNGNVDTLNFEQGTTAVMGNLFNGIPSSNFPVFEHNPNLKKLLVGEPQNSVWFIGQSVKYKPFSNPKVRVALEYAINKQKIVQLENGRGLVANQPLPPGINGYMKNLPAGVNYTYDPAKARALLKAAGVPHAVVTLYSQNDPDFIKMTQSIANDLANVGWTCHIHLMDDNVFWSDAEQGKFAFFIGGWLQDFPDPSDFLNTLLNGNEAPSNNMTWYNSPQVNAWLNQAQTNPNHDKRIQLYDKVTVQMLKDGPWIPLYYPVIYSAAQSWVHGFYISPVLPDPLQYLWIDPGHSKG